MAKAISGYSMPISAVAMAIVALVTPVVAPPLFIVVAYHSVIFDIQYQNTICIGLCVCSNIAPFVFSKKIILRQFLLMRQLDKI